MAVQIDLVNSRYAPVWHMMGSVDDSTGRTGVQIGILNGEVCYLGWHSLLVLILTCCGLVQVTVLLAL